MIIIIGILAAIAIPVFLRQRQKGYDAADKSDLRNLASFEEIYLDDYGPTARSPEIQAAEPKMQPSQGVTLSVVDYIGPNGYCLSAQARRLAQHLVLRQPGRRLAAELSDRLPRHTSAAPPATASPVDRAIHPDGYQ